MFEVQPQRKRDSNSQGGARYLPNVSHLEEHGRRMKYRLPNFVRDQGATSTQQIHTT
jgi:hypothetical protein